MRPKNLSFDVFGYKLESDFSGNVFDVCHSKLGRSVCLLLVVVVVVVVVVLRKVFITSEIGVFWLIRLHADVMLGVLRIFVDFGTNEHKFLILHYHLRKLIYQFDLRFVRNKCTIGLVKICFLILKIS